ncbi:MAG: hypothetical protein M3081_14315 [Gemmatimonadota bacterium]|nr:hypothetical protein [Gemmatimonadota bacterium]
MNEVTPAARSGHKAAAISLWIGSTIVALVIYLLFKPSAERVSQCIAAGGGSGNQCNMPGLATGAIVLVILFGWGAAARAWRND